MRRAVLIITAIAAMLVLSCGKQQEKSVLYYYDPSNPKALSDKPMKNSNGADYLPYYSEAKSAGSSSAHGDSHDSYYTCPMHPQIHSDKPGKCPICGMDLVIVKAENGSGGSSSAGMDDRVTITVSPERRQLIGVKTSVVRVTNLVKTILTPGVISHDSDLYNLQQEYISVIRNYNEMVKINGPSGGDSLVGVIRSLEYRLMQMGYSREQIASLASSSQSDLSLILPGRRAWVNASIYENDIVFIKAGLNVVVDFPSNPGKSYKGKIYSINTALDPETRSFRARILIENFDASVRHEARANVRIEVPMGKMLAVPEDAVIDTGLRQIVFVDKGSGVLEPREVVLGARIDDYYAVLSGLSDGDTVVTSANFLIDSDSQIKAVMQNASR